jgi:hypothetical protein
MRIKETGALVVDHYDNGDPYQVYSGDLWECRVCGAEVVVGFGGKPILQSFESDFASRLAEMKKNAGANRPTVIMNRG